MVFFVAILFSCAFPSNNFWITTLSASEALPSQRQPAETLHPDWVRLVNTVGRKYYMNLRLKRRNFVFSPYSLSMCVSLLYHGARGKTRLELGRFLGWNRSESDLAEGFKIAARIIEGHRSQLGSSGKGLRCSVKFWLNRGPCLLESYQRFVRKAYRAEFCVVDFMNPEDMKRIKEEFVKDLKPELREGLKLPEDFPQKEAPCVLTTKAKFFSLWAKQFDPRKTEQGYFWVSKGKKYLIPFMYRIDTFKVVETKKSRVLKLEYTFQLGNWSMLVVLPKAIDGLNTTEKEFFSKPLSFWTEKLNRVPFSRVHLYLPKFSFSQVNDARNILKELGVVSLFDSTRCNLSAMFGAGDMWAGRFYQRGYVEVNEFGTSVGSEELVEFYGLTNYERIITFRADRPFMFVVCYNAGAVPVFLGRFCGPQ